MHLRQVNRGILPLLCILGLFKLPGLEAVESQKSKQDSASDYDYEETDVPLSPESKPTVRPFFSKDVNIVYASHEGENVTLTCQPEMFDETEHQIIWYRNEYPISTGNHSLSPKEFDVDSKFSLTIFNYTQTTPGNFSCVVLPGNVRLQSRIEFRAPENIAERNAAMGIVMDAIRLQGVIMAFMLLRRMMSWN